MHKTPRKAKALKPFSNVHCITNQETRLLLQCLLDSKNTGEMFVHSQRVRRPSRDKCGMCRVEKNWTERE